MTRLFFFIVIIICCSCKSKEVSVETVSKTTVSSDISLMSEKARQDTTKTKKVEQTEEFTRIYESETITEYDTEKGVPSKVTEKKKVTEQGKQVKTDESEKRGLNESDKNKLNHYQESEKNAVSKKNVKDESAFGLLAKSLGKWLGIGICSVLFLFMIWEGIKNKLPL